MIQETGCEPPCKLTKFQNKLKIGSRFDYNGTSLDEKLSHKNEKKPFA